MRFFVSVGYIALVRAMYQDSKGIPLWIFVPTVVLSAIGGCCVVKWVLGPFLKRVNRNLGEG